MVKSQKTTRKFMVMHLCPGTDKSGPRAGTAMAKYDALFPITVQVRAFGADPEVCPKCGAKRYKLTTESQVNTERLFGFVTREERAVCDGMGALIR